jgi:hypothetical protein
LIFGLKKLPQINYYKTTKPTQSSDA